MKRLATRLALLTILTAACGMMEGLKTTTPPAPQVPSAPSQTLALPASITPSPSKAPPSTATYSFPDPAKLGAVERDLTYCTAGGVDLKMDMHYPASAEGPLPVVVWVHGGSWTSGDKTLRQGRDEIVRLTQWGYLLVSINYRLAPEHKFPAQIEDLKCAIRHLRANAAVYGLDVHRIGAMGSSAGGHLVSLLGVTDEGVFEGSGGYAGYASQVQAVVDMAGPIDLTQQFAIMTASLLRDVFGINKHTSPILVNASPTTYITPDDPPFLIFHGDQDNSVSITQSWLFYKALKEAGVPVEFVVVVNAGHNFTSSGGAASMTFEEIVNMSASFFGQMMNEG